MSRLFTDERIDLSRLPAPDVIKPLDYEGILQELKDLYVTLRPDAEGIVDLEGSSEAMILEAFAYRELLLRAHVNDEAKAVMLPFSWGTNLDNLIALFNNKRLEGEEDPAFKERHQTSLDAYSGAGPRGAYEFYARSADPSITDVKAFSNPDRPGNMIVVVQAQSEDSPVVPSADLLQKVRTTLDPETVIPETDYVTVQAVKPVVIDFHARLTLYEGPDGEVVRQSALEDVQAFAADNQKIGRDANLSALYARLHKQGVQQAEIISPAADVVIDDTQVVVFNSITLELAGTDW